MAGGAAGGGLEMDTALAIPREISEQMARHAEACLPEEACGLLAGRPGKISRIFLVENDLHSPVRFHMHPLSQWKALDQIDKEGLELLGIFHSHPAGPSEPSRSDVREFLYPGVVTIILSRGDPGNPQAAGCLDSWVMRAFLIENATVSEVILVVEA